MGDRGRDIGVRDNGWGIGSGILGGRFGLEDREWNNGRDKDLARGREGGL